MNNRLKVAEDEKSDDFRIVVFKVVFGIDGKVARFVQTCGTKVFKETYLSFTDVSYKIKRDKMSRRQNFFMQFYVPESDGEKMLALYDYYCLTEDLDFVKVVDRTEIAVSILEKKDRLEFVCQDQEGVYIRKIELI